MKREPAGWRVKAELERRLGRKIRFEPEDEDLLNRLEARARQIDPAAFAAYDRWGHGAPRDLQDRRGYALGLAADEYVCADRPDVAAALRSLGEPTTLH